ncbi:MAG: hypothetical protein ACXADH_08575 [Candidatus Kariarchaeaceae archaeon]|jgi:hypothetical protein
MKYSKLFTIFMITILSMGQIASVIELGNVEPVIITFGDSKEEVASVQELLRYFPTAKVIEFGSENFRKVIQSTDQPIIYTGHGSDLGIKFKDQLIPWLQMTNIFGSTSADQYLLSCDSYNGQMLAKSYGVSILGFNGKIDAVVGAQLVALMIFDSIGKSFNVLSIIDDILERADKLINDMSLYLPLYIIEHLGIVELTVGLFNLLMNLISIVFTLTSVYLGSRASDAFKAFVKNGQNAVAIATIVGNMALFIFTQDLGAGLNGFLSFISESGKFIAYLIWNYINNWFDQWLGLGALAADTAANTNPIVIALKVGAFLLLLWSTYDTIVGILNDISDCDDDALRTTDTTSCNGGSSGGGSGGGGGGGRGSVSMM